MDTTPKELARFALYAAVAELADAQDLKSCGTNLPCRFDSGLRHLREKVFLYLQRYLFLLRCIHKIRNENRIANRRRKHDQKSKT